MSMISKEESERLQLPLFRIGLFDAIINGYIKLNGCNFGTLIKNPVIIKKKKINEKGKEERSSSSDTIVILGKLNFEVEDKRLLERIKSYNDDVVLKISFGAGTDNSLEIERDIYIDVVNRLYFGRYTPNVILTLGAFECSTDQVIKNMKESFENAVKKGHFMTREIPKTEYGTYLLDFQREFNDFVKTAGAPYYNDDKINVLLLERGKGQSLKDWSTVSRSLSSWLSVLFQILYTLLVFEVFGLKHNDLHVGNVFIQENITPQTYIYIVSENTYFEVPVKYLVKIYDFDLGSFTGVGSAQGKDLELNDLKLRNTKLDIGGLKTQFCYNYGVCNKANPKFDPFTVLDNVYNYIVPLLVKSNRIDEANM